MPKLRIYLDTSVYSAYFDTRDRSRQDQTIEFWGKMDQFVLYISDLNISEIENMPDQETCQKIKHMLNTGHKLEITDDVMALAERYVESGMIPKKFKDDAIHLAIASVHGLDIIFSWNYKHIVKRKTRIELNLINSREGYKSIEILSPPEV